MREVHVFEGLFSYLAGFASRPLQQAGIKVIKHSWLSMPTIPEGSIVVGHSFGGWKALIVAERCKPKLLVTIDPRWFSNRFYTTCPNAFNFFQLGFMRGYKVEGALDREVQGHSHTSLPSIPHIATLIKQNL